MTHIQKKTINCVNCGNKICFDFYSIVRADTDPFIKDIALSGNINSGFCNNCNTINKIDNAFLYQDTTFDLMAWVYPKSYKNQGEEIAKRAIKEFDSLYKDIGYKKPKNITVAFGIDDLKTKLKEIGDLQRSELKLYSGDSYGSEFIANIYVDDKKLVVEAIDQKVKDDLYREISTLIENEGIYIFRHVFFENDNYTLQGSLINIDHPGFLYALKNCSYLWQSKKTYGGHHIIYGFNSFLFDSVKMNIQDQSIFLVKCEKNDENQKFNLIVCRNPHKNQDYAKYIIQNAIMLGHIYLFYRAMPIKKKEEWKKIYFNTFNETRKFIDDYAKESPMIDFLKSWLSYEFDEIAMRQCNDQKFNFLEQNSKKNIDKSEKMSPKKEILFAHSGEEEHLYLLTKVCTKCGKRGTISGKDWKVIQGEEGKILEKCLVKCHNCATEEIIWFDISSFFNEREKEIVRDRIINKSKEPSRIIDIVDHTNLATFYFNILKKDIVKKEISDKRLNYFAKTAQGCIKEALKFYGQSQALDESKSIFSDLNKRIYESDRERFSFKYLKFRMSKINSFCNNLSVMREIYNGLSGEIKTDIKYLRNLRESKYKDNKEIIGEIARIEGPLIFKTLPPEAIKEWNEIVKKQKPPWEIYDY